MLQLPYFSDAFLKAWNDFVALVANADGTVSAIGLQELRTQQQRLHEELVEIESLLSIQDSLERHFEWPLGVTEESLREDRQFFQDRSLALEMVLSSVERGEIPPRVSFTSNGAPGEPLVPDTHALHKRRAVAVATLVVVDKRSFHTLRELEIAVGEKTENHALSENALRKSLLQLHLRDGTPLYCGAPRGKHNHLRAEARQTTIDRCIAWCRENGIALSSSAPE